MHAIQASCVCLKSFNQAFTALNYLKGGPGVPPRWRAIRACFKRLLESSICIVLDKNNNQRIIFLFKNSCTTTRKIDSACRVTLFNKKILSKVPGKRFVTGASRVISVHSTGPAQSSLTSEIGRDRVYSGWYERIIGNRN